MINVSGSAHLTFTFPADRITTYNYYSDMTRLVQHLQYIELVRSDPDYQYRMYYNTVELGTYHIHVFCDVRMDLVSGHHIIRIVPVENLPAIETKVTVNSTTIRGYYSSEAYFYDEGDETRVEYTLRLEAKPPRPMGMRFMPQSMVDKVAKNITTRRIREIAENFISSSIGAFPEWLEQKEKCSE